jgi:hypothetical protein
MYSDFNNQMNAINKDTKDFHKEIIKLTQAYAPQADLIEFIVYVNDRLETEHSIFSGVISETLNSLLNHIIDEQGEIIESEKKFDIVEFLTEFKFQILAGFGAIIFILFMLNPQDGKTLLEYIIKVIK